MQILANISSNDINLVKLSMISDENMVIDKTVTFEDYKNAIINVKNDGMNYFRLGYLPNTFLDGNFAIEKELTGKLALYVPGQLQRMTYQNNKDAAMIPFPSLIFFFEVEEGLIKYSQVFSIKEKAANINGTTILCNYPYGNVSPYEGRICWGSNSLPRIKSFKEFDSLVALFINSPTNNDLFQAKHSVSKDITLMKLIQEQSKRSTFNNKLLVETNKTINDVLIKLNK